jgi:hypothetical protein
VDKEYGRAESCGGYGLHFMLSVLDAPVLLNRAALKPALTLFWSWGWLLSQVYRAVLYTDLSRVSALSSVCMSFLM